MKGGRWTENITWITNSSVFIFEQGSLVYYLEDICRDNGWETARGLC